MRPLPRFTGLVTALAVTSMLVTVAAAAETPRGASELEVVPLELPGQAEPSVVADRDGGFVLTHIDRDAGGVAHLRYALLDAAGRVEREGEITHGKDWFVNWADFPSLVIADNGDWVTFVLRRTEPSRPYAYEIRTTRSTDRGRHWSEPQVLHDDATPTEHGFVSLVPDGRDRVLALWLDGRRTPTATEAGGDDHGGHAVTTLRSAVLTRSAAPAEATELDELTCDCCATDAVRAATGPLAVYRDRTREEIRDVYWLQRRGRRWGAPQVLHADRWQIAGCPVNGPALATSAGTPVAAWPTMIGTNHHVRVAALRDGRWSAPLDLEHGAGVLGRVDVAAWRDDGVLVSWLGGSADAVTLRVAHLDRALATVQRLDVTTLPAGRATGMPRLASQRDRALVVWTSPEVRGGKVRGALLRPRAVEAAAGAAAAGTTTEESP
jgi:hypothetical protein